jgi:hypothetical protein
MEYVDIKEAARILHLCEDTVSEYLRKGILKGEKRPLWAGRSFITNKWFIPKSELERYKPPHVFSRNIPNFNNEVRRAIAWAIAAEGTITIDPSHSGRSIGRIRASPVISVSNTEKLFVTEFFKMVGKVGYVSELKKKTRGGKSVWLWSLSSMEGCLKLLEQIYEFLPIKKKQAELVMQFCRSRLRHFNKPYSEEEIELIKKVRALQHRGKKSFDWSIYNRTDRRTKKHI